MSDAAALLVLHDGAAGNRRQALALVEAWQLPFEEMTLASRAPWRWVAPRRLPRSAAAFGPDFTARLATPPALAVGCGRQAALATRLLREHGARTLQILHPRLSTSHWDRVVLPTHDGVSGGNVLTLDGSLNPIDESWLARERAAYADLGDLPSPRTALLVGGPTAASDWNAKALASAVEVLLRWHERDGGSLLVACSRRTPDTMRRQLQYAFAQRATVWTGTADGRNPYTGMLAWADRLVVTPDSANLLSEAAATNAPMWVAFPQHTHGRLRGLVDKALESGRARALGVNAATWPVVPWRESRRLAESLRPWVLEALGVDDQRTSVATCGIADRTAG